MARAQGALLLVLFQGSHAVEHALTARAAGSLAALFQGIPQTATVLEMGPSGAPDMGSQRQERAAGIRCGATILVKPGETVRA